jgi:allantoinase
VPPTELHFRCHHTVTPGGVVDAYVSVFGGRIDRVTLPGLVDTHVHVNEPGRTEWEGFETATRAAAKGGVTTIVDMPLNCIPASTSAPALREKLAAARGKLHVDAGFWGGVVPGNASHLEALAREGALGFKCFLTPSGVDEFQHVEEWDLREAMKRLASMGLPLLAHAEHPASLIAPEATDDPRAYESWLRTRPPAAELRAIRLLSSLAHEFRCALHVVHLACADGASELAMLKRAGLPITVETCPHYLFFEASEIGAGATEFKCAPPIREGRHREALWKALRDGTIDLVASDHSPCPPAMKARERGDFFTAWGGIASLELGLSAVWTAARLRGHSPADLARWMSTAPAKLAGLERRKGAIATGLDADLVVFDPDAAATVDPTRLQQRHPVTPYAGRALRGRVLRTYLRGELVWDGASVGQALGAMVRRDVR